MDSNVTLRSNVYINKTQSRKDPDFFHQIYDYRVLSKFHDTHYATGDAPLTPVQLEIVQYGVPQCSHEHGTMSWGVPIGSDSFRCRCEETACPLYPDCSSNSNFDRIVREETGFEPVTEADGQAADPIPSAETAPLMNLTDDSDSAAVLEDVPPEMPAVPITAEPVETESALPEPAPIQSQPDMPPPNPPRPLSSQDAVIHAGINSRIWLNAGPGTGKTYTVVKRLRKIFEEDDPEDAVVVLCFSKNAVRVIGERLRQEIGGKADALLEDERLIIRTFDSFATYALDKDLPLGLGYDQRIELFIKTLLEKPDTLEAVQYLIVDEVQDTVGVRARMLKAMIETGGFGVLLAGDRCQAIYDWSARAAGDWTSAELFEWIGGQDFQFCELEKNHRQAARLGELGGKLRQALLSGGEAEQQRVLQTCKDSIMTLWPGYAADGLPKKLTRQSELILCKTNGEAAVMSDKLFGGSKFVSHTVLQGSRHRSLAPWIGMILGGCTDIYVSREDFTARARQRGIDNMEEKWNALKSLDRHPRSAVLHRAAALRQMAKTDALPDICLNHPGNGVVVSTVHRAKGSEAEHVYWIESPLLFDPQSPADGALADALRASYVAVTRAKRDIRIIHSVKKVYMKSIEGDRWIKTGKASKTGRKFCSGITIQPDDVDLVSCAAGADADARQMQETIGDLSPGLDLELYPAADGICFDIYFDGSLIGRTAPAFTDALFEGFRATNKNPNMPACISSVYVSELITAVQPEGTDDENDYQKSGCWLGYELGGFANIFYS